MEEGRLAYRVRTAERGDDVVLRASIGTTLAHPDRQGARESYRGASERGELLVLEHYDRQAREWRVAGFVEHHLRVDDSLTIRDVGTAGAEPQVGVVRYLLDSVFNSLRPTDATIKIRRDARDWIEIFEAIPGFELQGEEYRRPHYWTIWQWTPQRAREVGSTGRAPERGGSSVAGGRQDPRAVDRFAPGAGGPPAPPRRAAPGGGQPPRPQNPNRPADRPTGPAGKPAQQGDRRAGAWPAEPSNARRGPNRRPAPPPR